jgi:hypothetical protein
MKHLVLFEGTEAFVEVIGLYNSAEEAKKAGETHYNSNVEWEEAYPDHAKGMVWLAEVDDGENFYTIREV